MPEQQTEDNQTVKMRVLIGQMEHDFAVLQALFEKTRSQLQAILDKQIDKTAKP